MEEAHFGNDKIHSACVQKEVRTIKRVSPKIRRTF